MTGGIERLLTEHLDTWTAAVETKSAAGRGSSKKLKLVGIAKLRELILELAVRGQLVPQNESDEPASVLLERIAAERERLIQEKKIKKPKVLPEVSSSDAPFLVPPGWALSTLGISSHLITKGTTPTSVGFLFQDSGIFFIKVENIDRGVVQHKTISSFIDNETHTALGRSALQEGDILFSIAGTIGKTCIVHSIDLPANTNQALAIIRGTQTVFDTNFLRLQLESFVAEKTRAKARGGAMPNVSLGDLTNLVCLIPPIMEQMRIVSKVDELMALCDALEQEQENSIAAHSLLVENLLAALMNAAGQGESKQAWTRVAAHFDTLFTTEQSVEQLKQTILQLAVMGKLVEQDPADESAGVLLERIEAEKERLVEEKVIKKQKALPEISEEEKVFDLPEGWAWCRLGNAFVGGSGSTPLRSKKEYFVDGTENWFKTTDLNLGYVYEGEEKITFSAVADCNLTYYPEGTVCIAMYGGGGTIGKSGILGVKSTINQSVFALMPHDNFNSKFLHLYIKSIRNSWMTFAAGLRKDPNINGLIIKKMVMPIPPLLEQSRIVTKVDELFALCDRLNVTVRKAQSTQLQVADTLTGSVS